MSNGTQPVRLVMIGCGGMARHHIRRILQQQDTTQVVATCEPSGQSYEAFCELFEEVGLKPPPNEPNLEKLLQDRGDEIDAGRQRGGIGGRTRSNQCPRIGRDLPDAQTDIPGKLDVDRPRLTAGSDLGGTAHNPGNVLR